MVNTRVRLIFYQLKNVYPAVHAQPPYFDIICHLRKGFEDDSKGKQDWYLPSKLRLKKDLEPHFYSLL